MKQMNTYYFQKMQAKRSFGGSIFNYKIISKPDKRQNNLLESIPQFKDKFRPRLKTDKEKKEIHVKIYMLFTRVKY